MKVGAHVSIEGGIREAPVRAVELGANALGMFTANQRQWAVPPLPHEQVEGFRTGLRRAGIQPRDVVVHASYLLNVGNPDLAKRRRAQDALIEECRRVEQLGLQLVNFHPGSGLGAVTEDETMDLVASSCVRVLGETDSAVLVLETTAGQGANVGYRLAHLARIIERAGAGPRLAVCIDTCHLYAAGYDISTPEGYALVMEEFDREVGMDRLAAVHLNDSLVELGSRKDRHESIGRGLLGLDGIRPMVSDPRLAEVPFILETRRPELWKEEIALVRSLAGGSQAKAGG